MNVLKLFKKLIPSGEVKAEETVATNSVANSDAAAPAPEIKENAKAPEPVGEEISPDSEVSFGDAKATLGELIEAHNAKKVGDDIGKEVGAIAGSVVGMDCKVMHNGKEIAISDLVAAFDKLNAKEAEEAKDRETKENAKREADAKLADVQNSKMHLDAVLNAPFASTTQEVQKPETLHDQLARGKALFGEKK